MTERDELRDRLDDLEGRFGVGPTSGVLVLPTGVGTTDEPAEWPDGVTKADVTVRHDMPADDPIDYWEEPVVPIHRPPAYRGGFVIMSEVEIAQVFASMPDDVREKELELRIEQGEPIPGVLQQ